MESQRPILRWFLVGLAVFTVLVIVVGNLYQTPLKTVNIVNDADETITITTTVDKKVRVFSAAPGGRANVQLRDQDADCSEQSFAISTPSKRRARLEGRFCQDENHSVTNDMLVADD